MKAKDLREMTIDELTALEKDQKEKLYKLRFQLELSQLQDTSQIKQTKRDIARIKTLIRERELGLTPVNSNKKGNQK
ncbi:MAG: 50S ribosomal protein L29 [Mesoaciditoga sp.]|uniref:50S ribosomal protein L29 n=1 Tax=Athalassotoga TaxID=1769718 RepID=UPI000CAEB639|nr:50S ribosomal protein L29 [Athalassotoga saccharophila]PMP69903.1 MAG: 50S ribosomal protein L29 [Mesoaciditoga sp.]PMP79901.1 MAG: 50S ribosomal protein L29 [Mesoaciditoga sp.]BBJ27224.1 50S ribosomal protein L29 [Athalassotoga saccharophila]HEU23695.1 50S ribosomal protein L29 [Mesoaciditoga lauensis]